MDIKSERGLEAPLFLRTCGGAYVRSMLNADLASGCDVVIVVSCFAPDVARPIKNPDMAAPQCRLDFGGGHRTWLAQALQEAGAIRPAWGS